MSDEVLTFEVTDTSYGKYVLLNSHKVPVVMSFIAPWSEHCFVQDRVLTDLAEEFAEQFVFAKLDIDENAEAKDKYEVTNVPTTIVFVDGKPVRREEGLLDEAEAREMLKAYDIYRESDDVRMQARHLHMDGQTPQAITMMAEAMRSDPSNTRIAMDMVQIFIDIKQVEEADSLFSRLPESDRDSDTGRILNGQLWARKQAAKTEGPEVLSRRIAEDANDLDARFDMAVCLVAENNYPEAMTHLFYLLENEPEYKEGAPREMIVALINTLSERDPDVASVFRRQLASVLNG